MNKQVIEQRDKQIKDRLEKHPLPETVYHYTSINSFYGIITGKEMRFGDSATMNDSSETIGFIQELEQAIKLDMPSQYTYWGKEFFESIYKRLQTEYPYIMCFSMLEDNAAQWERYADDAKGICMGFNTFKLAQLFSEARYINYNEVFYNYDIREHELYDMVKSYLDKGLYNESDEKMLSDQMLTCASVHKNKGFMSEEEFRLFNLWNHTECFNISFKLLGNTIRKFMIVSLADLCEKTGVIFEDIFDSITVGPKSNQDIQVLKDFLNSEGYAILCQKVRESECPLR